MEELQAWRRKAQQKGSHVYAKVLTCAQKVDSFEMREIGLNLAEIRRRKRP
jgi:hypothetical protein